MRRTIIFSFFLVSIFICKAQSPANSFFVIHCDPGYADDIHYNKLQQMIDTASAHNVPLTLELSPPWVNLILADPVKLDSVRSWQKRGHEIAAHHHSVYHCFWDSITNFPIDSIIANQPAGPKCDSGILSSTMKTFWDDLDTIAGDSLMLTWGSTDDYPAVDLYPDIPYRTDGGRDSAVQGFSNIYLATHGPTTVGSTTYGPYTTCSIDYYFIEDISTVQEMRDLYNDSTGFSNMYNTVGVVTHVFNFKQALSAAPPNYYYTWINFIEGKGCQTVREILRKSSVCSGVGIEKIKTKADFKIYPNPASTTLYIVPNEGQGNKDYQVKVYNIFGQKFISEQSPNSLKIQNLENGVYFVKITSELNEISIQKFVKE